MLYKDRLEWVVFGLECSLMVGNRFGPIVRGTWECGLQGHESRAYWVYHWGCDRVMSRYRIWSISIGNTTWPDWLRWWPVRLQYTALRNGPPSIASLLRITSMANRTRGANLTVGTACARNGCYLCQWVFFYEAPGLLLTFTRLSTEPDKEHERNSSASRDQASSTPSRWYLGSIISSTVSARNGKSKRPCVSLGFSTEATCSYCGRSRTEEVSWSWK